MTLSEAKQVAENAFPNEFPKIEVLSAESLVRKCFSTAECVLSNLVYEVYGDDILIGSSTLGPICAWIDAAQSLPHQYLSGFEVLRTKTSPFVHLPEAILQYYVQDPA